MIAPITIKEVNRYDSILFEDSFDSLMEIVEYLDLDIQGSYLTLDSAFDNVATKAEILLHGMKPVIKPNLRGLKNEDRRNEILDAFAMVEDIYKERITIERLFAWEDTYRKLVIRYEKLQIIHIGFKLLAFSMINFRHLFGGNRSYSL